RCFAGADFFAELEPESPDDLATVRAGGWPPAPPRGFVSKRTSFGDLSSRSPLHDGWRSTPSLVHSVKCTSATSLGSTQCTPRASAPCGGLEKGGEGRSSASSRFRRSRSSFSVNPVPTLPA